jgi:hypothetical protein
MKRWLVVLIIALLFGALGFTVHQNSLEIIGLVLLILAMAALIWSWVRLSYEIRPRRRRRSEGGRRPLEEAGGVRRSRTDALHAMIFRTSANDQEK